MPGPWNEKESCIAFYFIARDTLYPADVASKVILLKCGTERSAGACRSKVEKLRVAMPKDYGRENPLKSWGYDLDIVDYWLSQQMAKGKLEDTLGIKDDKIVDEEVLKIVKDHLPPKQHDNVQGYCKWKLRIDS